ncbi:complement factor H isoform X3 [Oncorhynchus mykiss]|uniref:complement factor H isoform X3 n=1 Tax=Oncorhynchus mykiss TaxID=8022 RepID=UPI0018782347|nr:complement factor H isoform X3 [Oncorhynchus mykiss]
MFYSFHFYCIYHLINMKSSLTLLCLVVWMNVDASSAQTEVKCNLSLPPTRGTSYTPADRNLFLPDERVTVTCASGFWNSISRQTENTMTCKEDGKWSPSTTDCERITCGDPRDPLVSSPYYWQRGQFRGTQRYNCRTGFKTTNARGVATCTSDGSWTPEPLCEEITCDKPDILNAVIKDPKTRYKINDLLTYECKMNYELLDSTTRPTATCTTNGWTKTLGCKEVKCNLSLPPTRGTSYRPADRNLFLPDERVTVTCASGFWNFISRQTENTMTCKEDGKWSPSTTDCERITCGDPRDPLVSSRYYWLRGQLRGTQRYNCRTGFKTTNPRGVATCTSDGSWTPEPLCEEITCDKPDILNAVIKDLKTRYKINDLLTYECKMNYELLDSTTRPTATCTTNGWTKTLGCKEVKCNLSLPPTRGTSYTPADRNLFLPDERVTVTCASGFWNSISRQTENTMTCKEDGKWSPSTTDCERITCGDPRDPLVSSPYYWQRGQFRGTQRYNCRTGFKTTNARGVATCTSDGSWTPEPLCEEITCDKPDILNAVIKDPKTRYKINDLLTYECKMNYELLDSTTRPTATCTTNGWTKTLGCKEVKCNLSLPPTRGTSYRPADRNLFLPDERVTVTCASGFWNFISRQTENTMTCKEDGKWSPSTTDCERITCGDPRDPLVSSRYYWLRGQLRGTQRYNCRTGFKTTNPRGVATCTSDGSWTPEPLCEEITCDKPDILNAVIKDLKTRYKINDLLTYECKMNYELLDSTTRPTATCTTNGWTKTLGCKEIEGACINPTVMNGFLVQSNERIVDPRNSKIYSSCNVGFKPSTGGWWGEATCTEGTWSGILECIDQSQCGRIPVIPNTRKVPHSEVYKNEQTVTIDCKVGYTSETKTIKCKDGEWQTPLPACRPQGVPCDPPPKVENAIVKILYKNKYREGFEVNYECRKSFEIEGHKKLTCENGSWTTPPPTCKQIEGACINPTVMNGFIVQSNERNVDPRNSKIYSSCNVGFKPSTGGWWGEATCTEGTWSGILECIDQSQCGRISVIPNTRKVPHSEVYKNEQTVTIDCKVGYTSETKTIKCKDGEWQTPLPACRPQGVPCDPPPKVENAIVKILYKNKYREGFEVNYECRKSFEIEGHKKLTCENGSWTTPPPTCKQYCGKPEGAGRRMEIPDQVLERYENGNQIDYTCINPHKGPGGTATCKNGEWHMPVECNASCPDPPPITNGDFTKEKRDVEGVITEVSYQCSRQFTLSFTGSIRCLDGKWPSPPKCLRPCEISTFDAEYNLQNLPKKDYTAHGEKKTLHCKEGYYHKLKRYSLWNIEEIEMKCDDGELQYGEHMPICSYRYS